MAQRHHNFFAFYLPEDQPNLITSDNPLISYYLLHNDLAKSSIHILPIDFRRYIIYTISHDKDYAERCYNFILNSNPLGARRVIVEQQIRQAKRYIIFYSEEELNTIRTVVSLLREDKK